MGQVQLLPVYQTSVFGDLTPEDVKTVHETIARDCNESQFRLFMGIAKAAGANPILGEIHPSVFQGKLTTQFGIDFFVRKAKETDGYRGYDVQLVHDQDEFKMHQELSNDGRYFIRIDEHSFGFPRGKVIGGYAFAYREAFEPFSVIMDISEVEHYQRSQIGMQKTMWTNQLPDMFKKHMVKRVLKAAFGLTFENEERETINASPSVENIADYRQDVTPQAQEAPEGAAQQLKRNPARNVQDAQTEPVNEPQAVDQKQVEAARNMMKKNFDLLGIKGKDEKTAYINNAIQVPEEQRKTFIPSFEQMQQLNAMMEEEITNNLLLPEELE